MADPTEALRLSIIVTTLGTRPVELQRLLRSIVREQLGAVEVVMVDQSPDQAAHRLARECLNGSGIQLVCVTSGLGVNRGRDAGLEAARGPLVTLPDDDAWYPEGGLAAPLRHLEQAPGLDGLTFIARGEDGHASSATFAQHAGPITRRSALIQALESAMILRTHAVRRAGAFDPGIGLGSGGQWNGGDGADLLLRMLAVGAAMDFDPKYFVYHEDSPGTGGDKYTKLKSYSRGEGFVVARNRAALPYAYRRVVRPFIGMIVATIRGQHDLRRLRSARLTGYVRGTFDGIRRRT
jgi:hypothetical protein